MNNSIIKNSCKLVYEYPRIGRPNAQCLDANGKSVVKTNKRKFETNGCSKVNRDDVCKLKLLRG
jgi:hypothetical protein